MIKKSIKKYLFILIIFSLLIIIGGCSIRKIVVTQLRPVIVEVEKNILSEGEEQLVRDSLPFSIKFAEGLYTYYPTKFYSSKITLLYAAYAFAYIDESPYDDFDEVAEVQKTRATSLYKKAFYYGKLSLESRAKGFSKLLQNPAGIDKFLLQYKKEDVEALFWFNFSWAMLLFNDLSDVSVLVNLEIIKKIAERIISLDEGYYYGGAWAILAAYYGGRTASIGGNFAKAEEAYQKAMVFSKNKSLIPNFVMMRFVATQFPNSRFFDEYNKKIENFDITKNPKLTFLNIMLQRKGKELYKKRNLFFVD